MTPTYQAKASPIVTGAAAEKNIPENLRHAISFELEASDGLACLFVFLPLLLMTRRAGDAVAHWMGNPLLRDIGLATPIGGRPLAPERQGSLSGPSSAVRSWTAGGWSIRQRWPFWLWGSA